MVKPPRIRHSKSRKPSATIDLKPGDVKQEDEAATAAPNEEQVASTVPDELVTIGGADIEASAASTKTENEQRVGDEAASPRENNLFDAAPEPRDETASGGTNEEPSVGHTVPPRPEATGISAPISAVVAGLIGAAVALAGAGTLQWAGVLPGGRGTDATGASLEVLRGEIGVLRQEIADSRAAANAPATDAVVQSNARIDELGGAIDQLRTEVQHLQSSVPQEAGEGNAEATRAIESRLAQLETTVAALPQQAGNSEELGQRIASLEDAQRAATDKAAADVSRLEQLERSVADLSQKVEEQAAEPGMMLAVAAAALKSAIDRGTPFMTELESYAAIAPETAEVAALRDLAASGVPTHAQIEAELGDAADRMIAATKPVDPNAGFLDQLWSSAQSLVQVRPVGRVEGEGAPAIVARMEFALREGNYEKALHEYEALPEPAKATGEEFIKKVRARHTADQLVAKALSGAIKTPGGEG